MAKGEFEVFFGDQTFVKVGSPFGEDFGLVRGHAGAGQALDEGVGVEGGGLSLHGAQNSGWGGGCKRAWRCARESAPACLSAQAGRGQPGRAGWTYSELPVSIPRIIRLYPCAGFVCYCFKEITQARSSAG